MRIEKYSVDIDINFKIIFLDYSLLQSGHDCQSDGVFIGHTSSIKGCADLCRKKYGCQYFMLDKRDDDEGSDCFWKKMDESSCIEGWNQDSHKDTYALKGKQKPVQDGSEYHHI